MPRRAQLGEGEFEPFGGLFMELVRRFPAFGVVVAVDFRAEDLDFFYDRLDRFDPFGVHSLTLS